MPRCGKSRGRAPASPTCSARLLVRPAEFPTLCVREDLAKIMAYWSKISFHKDETDIKKEGRYEATLSSDISFKILSYINFRNFFALYLDIDTLIKVVGINFQSL